MTELEQLQKIITSLVVAEKSVNVINKRRGQAAINLLKTEENKTEVMRLIANASWQVQTCLNHPENKQKYKRNLSRILKNINILLPKDSQQGRVWLDNKDVDTIIHTAEIMLAQKDDVTLENVLENINKNIKYVENTNLFIVKVALSLFKEQHSWKKHIDSKIKSYIEDEDTRKKAVKIVLNYFNKILKDPMPTEHEAKEYREQALKELADHVIVIKTRHKILDMFAPSEEDKIPDDVSSIQDEAMSIHSYDSDHDEEDEDGDLSLAEAKALELTRLIFEVKDLSDTSMVDPQDLINIIPERLIKLSNDIPHAIQRKFS